ncbi:MAG: AAA family ATPase [Ignavibacteriae bacterium]|nr:AAA family ATPase [Ignavibacteriota bacterium]
MKNIPIISVCGKGGVGKTVLSSLLSKAIIDEGITPLLLVDADPVGGLVSAIGEKVVNTLADVRDRFIGGARQGGKVLAQQIAGQLDYFILNSLVEREKYSVLAMGRTKEKGCFCSANNLLKSALAEVISAFSCVLIDAEAGIEQINRDVTNRVNNVIIVVDASQRSLDTLRVIYGMVKTSQISVVVNRVSENDSLILPDDVNIIGMIPENDVLKQFDREGKSLWQLPADNEALVSAREIVCKLAILKKEI